MRWNWQEEAAPGDPEQNMAADAALLSALANGSQSTPTVRVYTWNAPAVSIGRLQSEETIWMLYPGLPIVRRPTGGRAVLHGEDLTISVAVRLDWFPVEHRSVTDSHLLLVDPVRAALASTGLDVCYGGCPIRNQKNIVNCFDLAASCDLIESHTGKKLVGSAQRREERAVLQQMSVSLALLGNLGAFLWRLRKEYAETFSRY